MVVSYWCVIVTNVNACIHKDINFARTLVIVVITTGYLDGLKPHYPTNNIQPLQLWSTWATFDHCHVCLVVVTR